MCFIWRSYRLVLLGIPLREVFVYSFFYRWGNWDEENSTDLYKVTWLLAESKAQRENHSSTEEKLKTLRWFRRARFCYESSICTAKIFSLTFKIRTGIVIFKAMKWKAVFKLIYANSSLSKKLKLSLTLKKICKLDHNSCLPEIKVWSELQLGLSNASIFSSEPGPQWQCSCPGL